MHKYLELGQREEEVIVELNNRLREARSEKWRGAA
jgi:hypothetical protein